MSSTIGLHAKIQYIAYDKKTGTILYTYSRLNAETNEYAEIPIEDLKKEVVKDSLVISRLTDRSVDNLDVIQVQRPTHPLKGTGLLAIDVKSQKLVLKPTLQLKSKKTQLTGDGDDKTVIEVQAVDASGKPMRNLDDSVRVTTDRGKLSERGGLVKLVQGHAK